MDNLFGSLGEFELAWTGLRKEDYKTTGSSSSCVFNSKEDVHDYMMAMPLFQEWRVLQDRKRDCNGAKRKAREIFLMFHPDKFSLLHPSCPVGLSDKAAHKIGDLLNSDKLKCKKS